MSDRPERILKILQLLQHDCQSLKTMASECRVHIRTVKRDIEALRTSGFPVSYDAKRHAYRMLPEQLLKNLLLTAEEAIVLITLCQETASKDRIPFFESVETAVIKLMNLLPPPLQEHLLQDSNTILLHREPINPLCDFKELFHELLNAYRQKHVVSVRYKSPIEPESFLTFLHPYHLFFARHAWYVIAFSSLHSEVRMFHLGRIQTLEETTRRYRIPKSFSLNRHFRNAWHLIADPGPDSKIVIRFSKIVAQNVAEVRWHPTQRVIWNKDGSIDFRVTVSGLREISFWVLGYGQEAEVLQPEALREMIKKHATEMVQKYQKDANNR